MMRDHLQSRGMNVDLYPRAVLDEEAGVASFLTYHFSGCLTGLVQYRPFGEKKAQNYRETGKYYSLTLEADYPLVVFGVELINPNRNELFVVEGLFKAAFLHRLGYNAISVQGSTPKPLMNWFYLLGCRYNLVGIGDGDKAGGMLVSMIGRGFQTLKDIDEMSDDAVIDMIEGYMLQDK